MLSVRTWILAGLALRALLLFAALPLELQSDEAHYAFLGLNWERFGFLTDSQRYLWPPAYPYLHKLAFQLFQDHGVLALRILQVSCSAATGIATAALARRLFTPRAATWAAALWALHLPLAGYTILGWPESLFLSLLLPALVLLHDAERDASQPKLIAGALLLGSAALFKELGLALALLLTARLIVRALRVRAEGRVAAPAIFFLATILPLLPWTARNLVHQPGLPIPSGVTLGENAYHGLNAHDHNFDVLPVVRAAGLEPRPDTSTRVLFPLDPDTAWSRPGGLSLRQRHANKISAAMNWASAHPGAFISSRLTRYAHTLNPLSFPVRHLALGHYGGPLGSTLLGRTFLILATLQSAILLLLGAAALARRAPRHSLYWITLLCFLAQPLLVGMSRLRVPLIPLLLIAIAGAITSTDAFRKPRVPITAAACVLLLWFLDARPILWLLSHTWESLA